jgi:molybdopterin converting factor subunit 1
VKVTVRFFASLRDLTGEAECVLALPDGARLSDLIAHLVQRYPALDGYQAGWHFAVNHTHAEPETVLHDGDRVAVLPYVAGG